MTGTAAYNFNTKDVATANLITESGLSLTGTGSTNYTLTVLTSAKTITAKALTALGDLVFPSSKVYDGNTTATPNSGSAALITAETTGSGSTSDGKPYTGNTDNVSLTGTAAYDYNTIYVLTATTITESGLSLTGTGSGNYTLTAPSFNPYHITELPVNLYGSRPFDGTTDADHLILTVTNKISGDNLTIAGVGTLASKDYGSQSISVVGTLLLGGTDVSNYTLTGYTGSVDITKAELLVTADNKSKTYDGYVYSGGYTSTITGYISPDGIGVVSGIGTITYSGNATDVASKYSSAYTITPVVTGLSATNYYFTPVNGTLNIYKKTLTVYVDNKSKCYGTEFNSGLSATFYGLVTGETPGSLTFANCLGVPSGAAPGAYTITLTGVADNLPFGLGNYDWTFYTGTMSVNALQNIKGNNMYYNGAETSLTGTDKTFVLYNVNSPTPVATLTSVGATYTFSDLCPGTYYIDASSIHADAGSVNGTDAAQVNYYVSSPSSYYISGSIEKVRFHAGDVGDQGTQGNLTINSTDASNILQHFVNAKPFHTTWTFWTKGDKMTGNPATESYPHMTLIPDFIGGDKTYDMYGLCTGDFNQSYSPSKTTSDNLSLVSNNEQLIAAGQTIDLPVRIVNASVVGAASIILNFDASLVDVQDVVMNANNSTAQWAVNGNELRIGWFSNVPFNLNAMDNLLTLKLKTKAAFVNGNEINFTLAANPANELANGTFGVISNAVLSVDKLKSTLANNQNIADGLKLSNYPNPFNGNTMINYTLPVDGQVSLTVYNYLGACVSTLVNENQIAGDHSLTLDAANFAAGIYTARIIVKSNAGEIVRTIKIVNNK